ncbi:hypothetical protein [Vagococcus sp. WN89Y]|uniref:hypothetical protein n=1 Tax=Vagococcus sp. WN89Y TaxID=3457258 RepID=UPI003FCE63E7
MKIATGVFFSLMCLLSFTASADGIFSGHWTGEKSSSSTLSLKISQKGERLTGTYCFVSQSGNRIDCPENDEINLWGRVNNNHADIAFNSSFGGVNGQAKLEVNANNMTWYMIQPPKNGEYYAPNKYTLTKELKTKKADTRKFVTDKFSITVTNKCGDFTSACEDMFYLGVRKSDNSVITLRGKTVEIAGQVVGAEFMNKNITYKVNYEPPQLIVSQGDKILVNQTGKWMD